MTNSLFLCFCLQGIQYRLRGGDFYGNVEIQRYGLWGSVCSKYGWDDAAARVACRYMYSVNMTTHTRLYKYSAAELFSLNKT